MKQVYKQILMFHLKKKLRIITLYKLFKSIKLKLFKMT